MKWNKKLANAYREFVKFVKNTEPRYVDTDFSLENFMDYLDKFYSE
jgi:hypothetical protein